MQKIKTNFLKCDNCESLRTDAHSRLLFLNHIIQKILMCLWEHQIWHINLTVRLQTYEKKQQSPSRHRQHLSPRVVWGSCSLFSPQKELWLIDERKNNDVRWHENVRASPGAVCLALPVSSSWYDPNLVRPSPMSAISSPLAHPYGLKREGNPARFGSLADRETTRNKWKKEECEFNAGGSDCAALARGLYGKFTSRLGRSAPECLRKDT